MNVPLVLPLVLPLTTAAISLLAWRRLPVQRVLALVGTATLLASGLVLLAVVWNNGIVAHLTGPPGF